MGQGAALPPLNEPPPLVMRDSALIVMAMLNMLLLTLHLGQDIVYGFEPGNLINLATVLVASVWLYATVALAGRQAGYALLLLISFVAPIIPIVHMSGNGVGEDIARSTAGVPFTWTLLALGAVGSVTFLMSMHGLWRLKRSVLGFVLWSAPALTLGGAVLGFIVLQFT